MKSMKKTTKFKQLDYFTCLPPAHRSSRYIPVSARKPEWCKLSQLNQSGEQEMNTDKRRRRRKKEEVYFSLSKTGEGEIRIWKSNS